MFQNHVSPSEVNSMFNPTFRSFRNQKAPTKTYRPSSENKDFDFDFGEDNEVVEWAR